MVTENELPNDPNNDPLGIRAKKKAVTEEPATDDPLGVRKKKVESSASSLTGSDISPAANYRQLLSDYNGKTGELKELQGKLQGAKLAIDSYDVLQQDPAKLNEFRVLNDGYKEMAKDHNKRLDEIRKMKVMLDAGKEAYDRDNRRRQTKLFNDLGLTSEERTQLSKQIYKQQYPDRAEDVDSGRLSPTSIDMDADDLATALTGKSREQLAREKAIEENRSIGDRVFGTFSRSIQKTLGFEMPAAAAGTVQNLLSDLKIKDEDLEKSMLRPGFGHQLKKVINAIPGATKAINEQVDDARVAAFEWAENWKKQPLAIVPIGGGVPVMLQNDQNLIRSVSQIKKPLDVLDFVFSNAGQGIAQIVPAIASKGATSVIQEIGNNQIEGTLAIAQEKGITPEEVIRQDLDEPITARNFGIIQGALEFLGASKVAKTVGFDQVKKDLKSRTASFFKETGKAGKVEFYTEGTQSALNQTAIGRMKGLGTIQAVKDIDYFQVLDESLAGAVGGSSVSAGGNITMAAANRIASFKQLANIPQKSEEQAEVFEDIMNNVVDVAKNHGDPRSPEEIKEFIQDEVLTKVSVPEAEDVDVIDPTAEEETQTEVAVPPTTDGTEQSSTTGPGVDSGLSNVNGENVDQIIDQEGDDSKSRSGAPYGDISSAVELARRYSDEVRTPSAISGRDAAIARVLEGVKVNQASLLETVGDKNAVGNSIAKSYLKVKGGTAIDQIAQDISHQINPKGDGTEVSAEDVWDFMKRNPNGAGDVFRPVGNEVLRNINARYKELTGKSLNRHIAKTLVDKNKKTQEAAIVALSKPFEDISQSDSDVLADLHVTEKQGEFEENMALRDELQSILDKGLTAEVYKSANIQKYLDSDAFTDSEKETINYIFEYARTEEGRAEIHQYLTERNERIGKEAESFQAVPGFRENFEGTKERRDQERQAELKAIRDFLGDPNYAQEEEQSQPKLKTKKGAVPNDHGVFVSEDIETVSLPNPKKGWQGEPLAEIRFVQLDNDKWIATPSVTDSTGGFGSLPNVVDKQFNSKEEALDHAAKKIVNSDASDKVRNWAKGHLIKRGVAGQSNVPKSKQVSSELDALFKELNNTLGGTLATGLNPQAALIGAKIVGKYVELGIVKFQEIAKDVLAQYGEDAFRKYFQALKAGYGSILATTDNDDLTSFQELKATRVDDFLTSTKNDDDTSTAGDLESNSSRVDTDKQVGKSNVSNDGDASGERTGRGSKTTSGTGIGQQGDLFFSERIPPARSEQSDTGVSAEIQPEPVAERVGRGTDNRGSSTVDDTGKQSGRSTTGKSDTASSNQVAKRLSHEEKVKLQERANRNVPIIAKDRDNIAASLPLLLPHQVDNVLKMEERFWNEPGFRKSGDPAIDEVNKGILFTDATGTGKTYTGLGIIKRFERMGKRDVLIVVPTDAKVKDWQDEGKFFDIHLHQLADTKDAGREGQMIITTYANFRQNPAITNRGRRKAFDLVMYDESHKIVSNESGDATAADDTHKQLTNAPLEAWMKARDKYRTQWEAAYSREGTYQQQQKVNELVATEQKRLSDATKVVFLSASPFSYHKNLEYADGYLFNIRQGNRENPGSGYNDFFVRNFGYRIRYNKLTEPDAKVDVGLLERQFHSKLLKAGAVSSTRLQLDKDYSREFVLLDDKLGGMIDEGYSIVSDSQTYEFLAPVVRSKFNFMYKNQLLEAMKAKQIIPRLQEHLEMGRKVVVFHSYNHSLPSHPFDFSDPKHYPKESRVNRIQADIREFNKRYPQYAQLDLRGLKNPIDTLLEVFGDRAVVFNGNVNKADRKLNIRKFNDDKSNIDIIIVQMEAGKEGISLHDITGKKQRVMVNLGLPTKPTDAIQTEGRIYRIGQMSDAIVEYPVLHLNFEKYAFSSKINERAKTAENLAFGEQARNLKDAFKEGYKAPITTAPHPEQGRGGRDADLVFDVIDNYLMAIKLYFNRGKRNAKTKAREGTDYFATPEPIGLKMVEWLYAEGNDHLLEPSAGHGAIARWFPENTVNKFVEPSPDLRADLAINSQGDLIPSSFEELNIINKFDGIAMNPPFGSSGKTAMEHLEKALGHLRDGGRVVVILPDGPAMNTRIEKWQESKESKDFFITGKISLPTVMFERAGTSVKSQMLIIDKQTSKEVQKKLPQRRDIDFSSIEKVEELFDRIKDLEMPTKLKAQTDFRSNIINNTNASAPKIETIAQVVKNKHTKTGEDLHTVRLMKEVDYADFKKAENKSKALGGYYSNYRGGGAIPGFIFKGNTQQEQSNKLVTFINNGFTDPTPPSPPHDPKGSSDAYTMMGSSSKGRTIISDFQGRNQQGQAQKFKMYDEVIKLAHKYNPQSTLGQDYNTRGAIGTFYNKTGNVRTAGLTDLSVAIHELTHALDANNSIIKDLLNTTKTGDAVRKRLTDVYLKYYPGAQANHNLRTRMVEGYATLVQKYIEFPNDINKDFADLVQDFLTPGGKYWTDIMGQYLQDVEYIVQQYQMLDPLSKMGTRITNDVIDQPNEKFLTAADKITLEMFDRVYAIEKLAKQDGTHFTQDDVSLWLRMSNNALQMAEKNISSKKQRFWNMDDKGSWVEKHGFNYYTLTRSLDKRGLQEEFAAYLYARRIKFEYDELNDQEAQLNTINSPAYLAQVMQQMNVSIEAATKIIGAQSEDIKREMERLSNILKNEGVSEKEANEAYDAGQQMFQNDETMYDALVAEDLEFAHNPQVQLLDDEGYQKFKARKGYSTFKRAFYDELVGDQDVPTVQNVGKTKVSQFLTRRGSTKPVLNPLMGAMINHSELLRKGMRQMVYNKFLAVAEKHPDLFQVLQLQTNADQKNRYPQEKDPNIIMARKDFKRVPILADKAIKSVLDENYDYHNAHLLERVGITMSQMFRTGTTGIFWQFFINNTFLDQIVAGINTRNGMWPFISSFKVMAPLAMNKISRGALFNNSMEAAYLKEYLFLAGTSQTFLSADIEGRKGVDDIIKRDNRDVKYRVARFFEHIAKFSTPGNATEIMTRGTEYILARKAGKPQSVALEEAGRVSAPFHHVGRLGGSIGQSYVRTVPYFNSSLQVLKQTKDSLNTKQGRVRYAFTALSMLAASTGTMLYLLDQDDDDERRQLMKSLPPDNLTKYMFLPNPYSKRRMLQIRVPEQLGWMCGIVNMMLMENKGDTNYKWTEYGEASASFMPTQLNPFNPTQMMFSYVPQGLKPAIETATGMKTYPNMRPIETARDKSLPPELRYSKYTSPGAIFLGDKLGWSPKKIDNFLEGTFGRSVKYLTGKPGAYGVDNIFNRELYMEASRQVQFFYETKEIVAQNIKAMEDGRKEYTIEEQTKLWQQDAYLAEIEGLMQEYKDADETDQETQMIYIRNAIFQKILELENITY
jgi:hypothetical protein